MQPTAEPTPPASDPVAAAKESLSSLSVAGRHAWEWGLARGPSVIGALLLLLVAWIAAGTLRNLVLKACLRARLDLTLSKFFANITKWVIIAFAVVVCLGTFGVNTTGFAAIFGATGLAVGLALQGNLGNLASGVLLLIFRPFKIGDAVIVAGQSGVIDGIDLFTTNLDTVDNRRIIIPNGMIFGGIIENQSRHVNRRVDYRVVVTPLANIEETRAIFERVLQQVIASDTGAVGEPAPGVAIAEIVPMTWTLSVWTKTTKYDAVKQVLLREVKAAIDEAKLGPPAALMEVKIKEMPRVVEG